MKVLEWIQAHEVLLGILAGTGVLFFLGSLVAIPLIIAWMPEDYFARLERGPLQRRPFRHFLQILKNILGTILFISGLMLVLLPGQGILTMLIGISLIDFPGKRRLQLRLVHMKGVARSMQWIRHKAKRPPLQIPEPSKRSPAR
ncbi:MAG TPA: PGPGW domain-containing protein [Oceanipulchritudo sp.]|nr:PGPGW domain-containing protein [Oceanipulchritudo sp.]